MVRRVGEARFVGGAVRNELMNAKVVDIDIAVPMPPTEALLRLTAKDIKVIETGMDHGTVTAIAGTHAFEITSLRRDVETDGRHAKVVFTDDWAEDAARRDFTINAMYASVTGEIFDYATGVEDLIAGKVRFMGDARARIAEDYLRVLRLFRFHAWYGKGDMDAEGLRAAAEAKEKLGTLSAERVAKEMLRLLEAGNPAPVLRVMAATGILPGLLPEALQLPRLDRRCRVTVSPAACRRRVPAACCIALARRGCATRCFCNGRQRRVPPEHWVGVCCCRWRKAGSGHAFRLPAAM